MYAFIYKGHQHQFTSYLHAESDINTTRWTIHHNNGGYPLAQHTSRLKGTRHTMELTSTRTKLANKLGTLLRTGDGLIDCTVVDELLVVRWSDGGSSKSSTNQLKRKEWKNRWQWVHCQQSLLHSHFELYGHIQVGNSLDHFNMYRWNIDWSILFKTII